MEITSEQATVKKDDNLDYLINLSTPNLSRDDLILSGLPYVEGIARKICLTVPISIELDDLRSEGNIGLIDAATRYDPQRGDFEPYAKIRIRGAIRDYLRKLDPLGRTMRTRMKHIEQTEKSLYLTKGEAKLEDVLAATGLSKKQYSAALVASIYHEEPLDDDSHVIVDETKIHYDRLVDAHKIVGLIDKIRGHTKLKRVLHAYFVDNLLLQEIGEELGVTESRASQIKTQGIKILQEMV
jgi:RNA polymerase sigma factor FliA